MKLALVAIGTLALLQTAQTIELPQDLSANNLVKFTATQLEAVSDAIDHSGLVPMVKQAVAEAEESILGDLFSQVRTFQAFSFDLQSFQLGMLAGLISILFQVSFLTFFPTFSWLPFAYNIRLSSPAMSLFVHLAKIGTEVFHQVDGNPFFDHDSAFQDLIVTVAGALVLMVTGDWGYGLGLLLVDFTRQTFIYGTNISI